MSNFKSISFLLLLIAVLTALLFFPFPAAERVRSSARVLLDSAADCRRIEIVKSGRETIVLEREARWKLVRPYAGEADEPVILRLLDKLTFTPVADVISDAKMLKLGRSYADFSLTEPPLKVLVSDRKGVVTDISFGARTPTADGVYATIAGQSAVLVMPTGVVSLVDVPAADFLSRRLLTSSFDVVESLDVKVGTAAVKSFVRTANGWKSDEGPVSGRAVDQYVTETRSASAVDFVWPTVDSCGTEQVTSSVLASYGLDPEGAVAVTFRRTGCKERILFGKSAEKDLVYAFIQNGGVIATVPAALKDTAVRASAQFLDSRLFPIDEKTVRIVTVCDGDTVYSLTKGDASSWRLETPISAPADKEAADKLLHRILTLTTADTCSSNASDAVSVAVSTNGVSAVVSRGRLMEGVGYEGLRSREVVRIAAERVRRLVQTVDDGKKGSASSTVSLAGERGVWNVEAAGEGDRPDEKAIAGILSALASLVAERVEKVKVSAADLDDYGLDRPFLTLAVDLKDETAVRRNILVGKRVSGGRYLTIGSSEAVFVVSEEKLEKLFAPLVRK